MKRARRRERKEYGTETARIIIALNPDAGAAGRAARGAAARKDFDNDHTATAARAWRAMIGRDVRIGYVGRLWRIGRWQRSGDQGLVTGTRTSTLESL